MATTFLEDVREHVHFCKAADYFCFDPHNKPAPTWWYYIEGIQYAIKYRIASMICSKFGHKYEICDSHADGESAYEDFHCTRCGHTIHHIYY